MKIFSFRPKNGLNFGDELGPYIVKHILNHLNLKFYPTNCDINFFSIGSVIHFSKHEDIVWGSGINGKVSLPINQISKNYLAVRGPRTQHVLRSHGLNCPSTFGDPAILLPKFYKPNLNKFSQDKILVIPNYNDFLKISIDFKKYSSDEFVLLHPFTHFQTVIDFIASAKTLITSSLHAKIIGDCFGVPNSILGGNGYAENIFKYVDYIEGIGHSPVEISPDIKTSLNNIHNPLTISTEITDRLINAFPKELFHAN